jgi:phage repressor protein C with HTH and peptisase S24 domain
MTTFADRLKKARQHARLTQAELATIVGIDQTSISNLERGKSQGTSFSARLADACGVSAIWLESGIGLMSEAEEPRSVQVLVHSQGSGKTTAMLDLVKSLLDSKAAKALPQEARDLLLKAAEDPQQQGTAPKPTNVVTGDFSRAARMTDGDILIPQYDVRASMGHGQVPSDYVEFVRNIVVSGPQLEKLGLEYTSPANLSIITGWGQSMAGTIEDKDPIIVDRGVTEFNGDGVYVLTWDDHLYIKRLQKADTEHFDLISDNPKHKDRVVHVDDVVIHARVLYVWRGMKV